jgi:hypothetical protein
MFSLKRAYVLYLWGFYGESFLHSLFDQHLYHVDQDTSCYLKRSMQII